MRVMIIMNVRKFYKNWSFDLVMKKEILLAGLILFGCFFMGVVSAELRVSEAGVQYDSEILEGEYENVLYSYKGFNDGAEWIRVSVKLKDNSGLEFVPENFNALEQWYSETSDLVIDSLSSTNFDLIRKSTGGFYADISENTFQDLINNDLIESVEIVSMGFLEGTSREREIELNFIFVFPIFLVIIFLIVFFIYKNRKS